MDLLNTQCRIYREIARIADVMRTAEPLRFGQMYYREISGDGINFGLPFGTTYTLAFSRLLYGNEVLVAYNLSSNPRSDFIVVDADLHPNGSTVSFLYGGAGTLPVHVAPNKPDRPPVRRPPIGGPRVFSAEARVDQRLATASGACRGSSTHLRPDATCLRLARVANAALPHTWLRTWCTTGGWFRG